MSREKYFMLTFVKFLLLMGIVVTVIIIFPNLEKYAMLLTAAPLIYLAVKYYSFLKLSYGQETEKYIPYFIIICIIVVCAGYVYSLNFNKTINFLAQSFVILLTPTTLNVIVLLAEKKLKNK